MPEIQRLPFRMDCNGIDLVHPIDRMPEGNYPYLFNCRVLENGRIESRPGYTPLIALADRPNSIRRLNDPDKSRTPAGYTYVGGGGTKLYAGTESTYAPVDTGFSGDPLSLITFRPDQAPESWAYVYDRNKSIKVRPDDVVRNVGIVPPTRAPQAEYGTPVNLDLDTGQVVTGWTATGTLTGPFIQDRANGSGPVITSILYNSGITGWACLHPSTAWQYWMQDRMKVILDSAGANAETVLVREIHYAIAANSISDIQYDVGASGLCSIVLNNAALLDRNSLITIGGVGEVIRILEVVTSPDGLSSSLRCSTVNTYAPGNAVTGLLSWYVYTTRTHVAAETISTKAIQMSDTGIITVNGATKAVTIDASSISNRRIDPADDYLNIGFYVITPQSLADLQFMICLDAVPNFSFSSPGNSYLFKFTADYIKGLGAASNQWVEIAVPISAATRTGDNLSLSLATITGLAFQLTTSGATSWMFDWIYLSGTYGPSAIVNSPTGYQYSSRNRDSSTGAKSVPGPLTRYMLFPLREAVIITPQATSESGVDSNDIYRLGGSLSVPLFVGNTVNDPGIPKSFTDTQSDSSALIINQPADLTALKPWPLLDLPWSGTVRVVGTSVIRLSGTPFNTGLVNNSAISINGTVFLTYGQPRDANFLEITQSAGDLDNAVFNVTSPTIAGSPLPFAFGPLEGPFNYVLFALGDPINGGNLYYSNSSDLDSAADFNFLELTSPSSSLVSGAIYNGMAFVGSKQHIYCVRYSYLANIGASSNTAFQWVKVPSLSGMWTRWTCCTTPLGVAYLGRDGIYIVTEASSVNITDPVLYPLFPHDGQPARAVNSGSNIILPVDMSQTNFMRLTYCDETLKFAYVDAGRNVNTIEYHIPSKRWLLHHYAHQIDLHYLAEFPDELNTRQQILMACLDSDTIMVSGGNDDAGVDIQSLVLTPSLDGGDERSQKLYVDSMTIADGTGTLHLAAAYDNAQSFSPVLDVACAGSIQQHIQNIASLADLSLHKNVGVKFNWTGGPDGPRLYAWESSGFIQPYLSKFFVTQFINLSFPGWKSARRIFPAIISNFPVLFTIKCQDGRTFGPYTLPSTNGQYKIIPQMVNHGLKDLAFAFQLDGNGHEFAIFMSDFVVEIKEWTESSYIDLAVMRT